METPNDSYSHPEQSKSRFRDKFHEAKQSLKSAFSRAPLTTPESKSTRIESIKEEIGTEDRDWSKKEVEIDSINVKNLPIDWNALNDLGHSINDLKDSPYTTRDLSEMEPPREAYIVLPHIASVIAHHRNPKIPITLPTESEIKSLRPWLAVVGGMIGKMSDNWGNRFDSYIEKRGGKIVEDIGKKVCEFADAISVIDDPKRQLLDEVAGIYWDVSEPEYEKNDSLFGFLLGDREVPVEDKIERLIRGLGFVREGGGHTVYSKQEYPLLNSILPVIKFPPHSLSPASAGIAGAEFMEGLAIFLKRSGQRDIPPSPRSKPFDFLDRRSWQRAFAEAFVPERLERIKVVLPDVLSDAHKTLPSDGQHFSDTIYGMAEGICVLREQGKYSSDVAKRIFR